MNRREFLKTAFVAPAVVLSSLAGDGKTDNTVALKRLLKKGGTVHLPTGKYLVSSRIKSRVPVTLLGDGSGATEIIWTNISGGLAFTIDDPQEKVTVKGITFTTTKALGGTGLRINAPNRPSSLWSNVYVEDVEFKGRNYQKDFWTKGLQLDNCWGFFVDRMICNGPPSSREAPIGVHVTGQSTEGNLFRTTLHNVNKGVVIEGPSEGTTIRDLIHVGGLVGVESLYKGNLFPPGLRIVDSHFNVDEAGINLEARSQSFIQNNLIYRLQPSSNFVGIKVNDSIDMDVSNNQVIDPHGNKSKGTTSGFQGSGNNGLILSLNTFTSFDYGIDARNNSRLRLRSNSYSDVNNRILK